MKDRRPGALRLHDVDDVEGLARDALNDRLRTWGAHLRPHDYEDALAYLVATAWEVSRRYDRSRSAQSFSTYAGRILRFRVADWYRGFLGDSRYGGGARITDSLEEIELDPVSPDAGEVNPISQINLHRLTPESRRALLQIAKPMLEEGLTREALADRYGMRRHDLEAMLGRLREELLEQDAA